MGVSTLARIDILSVCNRVWISLLAAEFSLKWNIACTKNNQNFGNTCEVNNDNFGLRKI